jgi:hypothetical protein
VLIEGGGGVSLVWVLAW